MRDLKDVIKELREKHGNKSQVAKKLGISSQRLGQYEKGRMTPKIGFFEKWKDVFKEDIMAIQKGETDKTNVSRGTENHTHVHMSSDNPEKPLGVDAGEVYRKIVEGDTEYVLIPRSLFDGKYRMIPVEEIESHERELARKAEELVRKDHQITGLYELFKLVATGRVGELKFADIKEAEKNAGIGDTVK